MRDPSEHRLFEPSFEGHSSRLSGPRPWRLGSQRYVGLLGGPLGAAAVGVLSGRRLGVAYWRLVAIGIAGVAGVVVVGAAYAATPGASRPPWFAMLVLGFAVYGVSWLLQRSADRRWAVGRADADAYDSLWVPGTSIAIGGAVVTSTLLLAV